jgi:hypothetical protein
MFVLMESNIDVVVDVWKFVSSCSCESILDVEVGV